MTYNMEDNKLVIKLEGRIDSNNARETEQEIMRIVEEHKGAEISMDAMGLQYISSAGLRVLMKLQKQTGTKYTIFDVSPEVYDILETTGFIEFLDVKKRMREVSVEGCKLIGSGGNGEVYRLDDEQIVKVYYGERNSLDKIRRNQEITKTVFLHGVPTTIAFDTVRVGENYGIVFEIINAKELAQEMSEHPEKLDHYAGMIADALINLHHTEFEDGVLPDARDNYRKDIKAMSDAGMLNTQEADKLYRVIDDIPARNTFVHQDFHPGNLMLQGEELIFIDVEDAGMGHPVLDLASMYLVYVNAASKGWTKKHLGIDAPSMARVWDIIIRKYFNTSDASEIAEINRILDGFAMIKFLRGIATSPRVPDILRPIVGFFGKRKLMKMVDTLHAIP